jgi:Hsp70 protein
MGWVNWSRKPGTENGDQGRLVGVDLNASRARAAAGRADRRRAVPLDEPHVDLPLAVSLERRAPEIGRPGLNLIRRLPHLVCANYLPLLGQSQEWAAGRHRLDSSAALLLAAEKIRAACAAYEGLAFALPPYLTLTQVTKAVQVIQKTKLKLIGTAQSALAMAGEYGPQLLHNEPPAGTPETTWVVPLHRPSQAPTAANVVILDADDYAMTGTVVRVDTEHARVLATATWQRSGVRAWKDRLLDALADRCVRLCRRDPRDSAEAEQALYEQIDDALERLRHGQKVALTVRAAHWYQDLVQQQEDFDGYCATLLRQTVDGVRELVNSASLTEPPRAVWLTHDAGRLPGLTVAVHQNMAERTSVSVLPPEAVAGAAAALAERWKLGELPRVHLDTTIPLPPRPPETKSQPAKQSGVRK